MQAELSQDSQETKTKHFTLELTPDQYAYLQTKMPILYSMYEVKKFVKKPKKDPDDKLLEEGVSATNLLPRSSRHLDSSIIDGSETQIKTKRSRPKKIDDYHDEEPPKRKIKQPPIRVAGFYGSRGLSQQETQQCMYITTQLKQNPNCKPFLQPVNPIELNIPDYFDVVTNPMDISTVEKKLRNHAYSMFKQFKDDIILIWMNSYKYNQKGSDIYYMTAEMDKLFNKLLEKRTTGQPVAMLYSTTTTTTSGSQLHPKKQPSIQKQPNLKPPKKPKTPNVAKVSSEKMRPMTIVQKRKLCDEIKALRKEHLAGVWKIVSENNDSPDLTFDIEKLPIHQLWQLQAYIREARNPQPTQAQAPIVNERKSSESSSFMVDSDSEK